MTTPNAATFASMVDHTLLAPEATREAVDRTVQEAIDLQTASVCLNGYWVDRAAALIAAPPPAVCTVVGFPLGATSTAAKAHEATDAVVRGANEIDMVANLGTLKDGDASAVTSDIAAVRAAIGRSVTLKVILETATLTDDEITSGCRAAEEAGADFVKTSTGFHAAGGASVEAVRLMADTVGGRLGVKASGGIRTMADVVAMLDAGATRLGMSATLDVLDEIRSAR